MSSGDAHHQASNSLTVLTTAFDDSHGFSEARSAFTQPFIPTFDGGLTPFDEGDGFLDINDFVQRHTPVDQSEFEPMDLDLMEVDHSVGSEVPTQQGSHQLTTDLGLHIAAGGNVGQVEYSNLGTFAQVPQSEPRYPAMFSNYFMNTDQQLPDFDQNMSMDHSISSSNFALQHFGGQDSHMQVPEDLEWILNASPLQADIVQNLSNEGGSRFAPVNSDQGTQQPSSQISTTNQSHEFQPSRGGIRSTQAETRSTGSARGIVLADVFAPNFDQGFDDIPMPTANFNDAMASFNNFMSGLLADWSTPENDDSIPTTEAECHAIAAKLYSAMKSTRSALDSYESRWGPDAKKPYTDSVVAYVCELIVETAVNLHLHGPATLGIRDEHFMKQVLGSQNLTFAERIRVILVLVRDFKCRADAMIKGSTLATVVGAPEEALRSARSNVRHNKLKGENIKAGKELREQADADGEDE